MEKTLQSGFADCFSLLARSSPVLFSNRYLELYVSLLLPCFVCSSIHVLPKHISYDRLAREGARLRAQAAAREGGETADFEEDEDEDEDEVRQAHASYLRGHCLQSHILLHTHRARNSSTSLRLTTRASLTASAKCSLVSAYTHYQKRWDER